MNALDAVAWIVVAPVCFVFGIFINEIALGLVRIDEQSGLDEKQSASTILIPAHNEATGIGEMLLRLKEKLPN